MTSGTALKPPGRSPRKLTCLSGVHLTVGALSEMLFVRKLSVSFAKSFAFT